MPKGQQHILFDILVSLPTYDGSVVAQLRADIPKFSQLFYHLNFELQVVDVRATEGDVMVEGELHAKTINIITTDGEVSGQFWADDSIHLGTSEAGISANIRLTNEGSRPTSAVLNTSNGVIVTRWLLSSIVNPSSPSYPGYNGNFVIHSTTSNALAYHTFEYAPINPNIIFETHTSNASTSVTMWRTMEGPFEMHGDIGVPLVETHLRAVDDPMQLGRDPVLKLLGFSRDMLEGFFHWRQSSSAGGRYGDVEEAINAGPIPRALTSVSNISSRFRIFSEQGKPMLNFV
ncbi:hypothetical protein DL93DRAFT_2084512 [Clavulina sp. PMI_390]|nr:hypothetical protein DL93DRAFT_2084512 [Clavulina sp. PMI_390]